MKVISEMVPIIGIVPGMQNVSNSVEYRWNNYCHKLKIDNKILILNNLTKEMILISKSENENLGNLHNKTSLYLVSHWFLVPLTFNEFELCNQIRIFIKNFTKNRNINKYNILTTTGCNARCFYCYEAGTKPVTMTSKTAEKTANYIINHSGNKDVSIQWFGGEPLCNYNVINLISDKLNINNIKFKSTMVSNGYIFNEKIIEYAVNKWHLLKVQITLDGNEKTYNKVKNYINPSENPFKRVINNIQMLLNAGIYVCIRLNMDIYNEQELYGLVDYLKDTLYNKDKLDIYAHMIYENVGFDEISHSDCEREKLGFKLISLLKYIDSFGLLRTYHSSREISVNACMADDPNYVMILPDGNLGKCEHRLDYDYFGNIYKESIVPVWTEYFPPLPRCRDCVIYPTCFKLKNCETVNSDCPNYELAKKIYFLENEMKYKYSYYLKINKC